MLRKPAFFAAQLARDSQREAFLAQQRVAAVTAADRPDRVVLRKMTDEAALRIEIERAMQAAIEISGLAEHDRALRVPSGS